MMRVLSAVSALSLVALASACSDSTSGSGSSSTSSGSPDAGGGPACNSEGVTVPDPTTDATLEGGGTPDFSCYTTAVNLPAPEMVTVKGCVDIFGLGRTVKVGMKISIYGIDQNPGPGGDAPRYTPNGSDIIVDASSGNPCESKGSYLVTGVPSNTPLIFKTYDTDTGANKTAVDTYQWNVVLRKDRHDADNDGQYEYAANMIFAQTYTTIPSVVARPIEGQTNLSDGLGRGAIAGEVRDCSGAKAIGGATVSESCLDTPARIAYFDGAANPGPVITRTSTNTDGLFSIVNVKANTDATTKGFQHEVEAKVKTPTGILSAGKAKIWVYPDSITVFSPQGLLPTHQ